MKTTELQRPKLRIATVSLAGCFGCHMSLLDIDERLFALAERVEFDRSRKSHPDPTFADCPDRYIRKLWNSASNVPASVRRSWVDEIS